MNRAVETANNKLKEIDEHIEELRKLVHETGVQLYNLEIESCLELRQQILDELAMNSVEESPVIAHRIISNNIDNLNLLNLSQILEAFQRSISLFFDHVTTNAPINYFNLPKRVKSASSLFPRSLQLASLQVNLYSRVEDLTSFEAIEHSIDCFTELISTLDSSKVREMSLKFGRAPTLAVTNWASLAANQDIGIELKTGSAFQNLRIMRDADYLSEFVHIVQESGESAKEIFFVRGQLDGGRSSKNRFWFKGIDGKDYSGYLDTNFNDEMIVNQEYEAQIESEITVNPTTSSLEERYILITLKAI